MPWPVTGPKISQKSVKQKSYRLVDGWGSGVFGEISLSSIGWGVWPVWGGKFKWLIKVLYSLLSNISLATTIWKSSSDFSRIWASIKSLTVSTVHIFSGDFLGDDTGSLVGLLFATPAIGVVADMKLELVPGLGDNKTDGFGGGANVKSNGSAVVELKNK